MWDCSAQLCLYCTKMTSFILRRVMQMIPVMLGITLIVFVLLRVTGDPVALMLPEDAPREQIDALRSHLGLDRPIHEQYVIFMGNLLQGDFGESLRYSRQPALPIVLERLPATLELAAAALLVAILISFPAGVIAAIRRNRWQDYGATGFAILGQAMPNFWLGIMLILIFSVELRWFPVSGRGGAALPGAACHHPWHGPGGDPDAADALEPTRSHEPGLRAHGTVERLTRAVGAL